MTTTLGDNRGRQTMTAPSKTARRSHRLLVGLELFTGVAAVTGGLLLMIAPDGSLLAADLAALHSSPFADWRVPGLLLGGLVGAGYLLAGTWQWRDGPGARALSILAGCGLVVFETAELLWIGFQALEALFAVVGATVAALAVFVGRRPNGDTTDTARGNRTARFRHGADVARTAEVQFGRRRARTSGATSGAMRALPAPDGHR